MRRYGSANDAFVWSADLHAREQLLPSADDRLRDRAEAAIRLQRGLTADLLRLFDEAHATTGAEHRGELGDWLPRRMLVIDNGVEEIWCALSVRATDGAGVNAVLRYLLFAALERHVEPAIFEGRDDWPTGVVEWFEVVRLGIR